MKTQFKHHIKFGSCWYDNFFQTSTRQQTEKIKSTIEDQQKKIFESVAKKLKT